MTRGVSAAGCENPDAADAENLLAQNRALREIGSQI